MHKHEITINTKKSKKTGKITTQLDLCTKSVLITTLTLFQTDQAGKCNNEAGNR